jgi:hypothetical protein
MGKIKKFKIKENVKLHLQVGKPIAARLQVAPKNSFQIQRQNEF